MSDAPTQTGVRAVFLSYAREDADAARRIADGLRAFGVEVWFDLNELRGGDVWDQKLRGQIRACTLFLPVISATTQARGEGYFRREWKLAVERTHDMAAGMAFIVPVVIDDTAEAHALVPEEFLKVQWTRLTHGVPTPQFVERVKNLLEGKTAGRDRLIPPASKKAGFGDPALQRPRPRWLLPVLGGVGVAVIALVIARPWQKPEVPASGVLPTSMVVAPEPAMSPLVARAWAIIRSPVVTKESLDTAQDLCRQAIARDSTDAEAWAAAAQTDALVVFYNFDSSEERRQQAQQKAARALLLAPDSFTARHAQAKVFGYATDSQPMREEATKRYRQLIAERPANRGLKVELGTVLRDLGHYDEAAALFEQIDDLNSAGWTYMAAGRTTDAQRVADKWLQRGRSSGVLLMQYVLKANGAQDLVAAHEFVGQFTTTELLEDGPAMCAMSDGLDRRDAAAVIGVLTAFPREYLAAARGQRGPKRYFLGLAHEIAGNREAARGEWRLALEQMRERQKAAPNDVDALGWEALLQARLGEPAEAERLLALFRTKENSDEFRRAMVSAVTWSALGQGAKVRDEVERFSRTGQSRIYLMHSNLRFSPEFDAVRSEPWFGKFLRDTLPAGAKPFDDQLSAVSDKRSASGLTPQASNLPPDSKSVAVLAFANLSDDKANEYFSDGISEELLNVLAKVPGLKVSARTSAFHFKGKDTPIPEIARQLGVAYVVEGSVRKQGDKVRITAQLIKAADGFHVWSDTFTRDLKDIFAVQDEIAGLIARQLQVTLGDSVRAGQVVNPEAYRFVLEGRHFWNLRTSEGFDRAEAAFRRAIALDPDYAAAHAGLASVLATRLSYRSYEGETDLSYQEAAAEARRAVALDPNDPQVYTALGIALIQENRLEETGELYRKAIGLNPNFALPHHWISLVFEMQGRIDEALVEIGRAVELDPLSGIAVGTQARMLQEAGRYAEAFAAYERAAAILPDRPTMSASRAVCLLKLNRRDEAVAWARKAAASSSRELRLVADADAILVLRQTGHEVEAAAQAERAAQLLGAQSYQRGAVLAAMGRLDEALPYLERTSANMVYTFFWNSVWDAWREDPRFTRLLEKLGRAKEYQVARETHARLGAQ